MRTLIYIYTAGYILFTIWTIFDNFKEKEPWWDSASDLIFLPLGAVGIFLYLFDADQPVLRSTWKGVTALIVLVQIATNMFGRHLLLSNKTNRETRNLSQWAILFADLTTVAVLTPMVLLNLFYAFPSC